MKSAAGAYLESAGSYKKVVKAVGRYSGPHASPVDLAAEHDAGLRLVHAVQLAHLVEQGIELLVAGATENTR